ncbi:antitoxin Xre/MbcA/ParS toxin-binding domain-containing protein (plasmid) [Limimaricola variabilis]|uniref:antitoxin Xre/MbcA/ParS toxin-binding domain-containing protein n=1 Tax=Limimaricola variabilis TaxID=1492771 RepID=UPI002AC8B090|nr:antitoxin Xre/MbcA/ParS toxin-binding domain-containing protein [Limimaricola variabilis]WPY96999.1 antitoxin Xre/MbcA/ParS toxin-binding domain-containing protein [Limimaricola variabilis]
MKQIELLSHPTFRKLMEMRDDDWGDEAALLHWLDQPNRSLGGARPSSCLDEDQDAILASFSAEISQAHHG